MSDTAFPAYQSILVKVEKGVGTITLNRPDELNAWDFLMGAELGDAYHRMDNDPAIRAIVLTGAGRAFCAGAKLQSKGKGFSGVGDKAEVEKQYPERRASADLLRTPVIAAVNGAAVGAGMTMALHADIRIMAEDAKLAFVFHRRGVIPDGDLLWSLPRQIGYAAAMDLLLTGRKFDGAEALRLGLASRIAPAQDVLALATEIAVEMADNVAPLAAAITKLTMRQLLEEPDRAAAHALQDRLFAWSVRQADAREGAEAFKDRRSPSWPLSPISDFPTDLLTGEPGGHPTDDEVS